MAESLNRAWRDLLGVLSQRGRLLELAVDCFTAAEEVVAKAKEVEERCLTDGWGHDVESVRKLIKEHEALRHSHLLEPTHRLLNIANSLLDLLGRLSNHPGPSDPYSATHGASQASVEARERVALITAKGGLSRRHAEVAWNRRDRLLQMRLTAVTIATDLDDIVDWFVKVGEPRLCDAQIGTTLSECETNLGRLIALGDEVREIQNRHTDLMRHLQQVSSSDHWRVGQLRTVFETLDSTSQSLESALQQYYGQIDSPGLLKTSFLDMQSSGDETWKETQSAYSHLNERMRTTEAYIWEFLDRLENRRRQLHTGVIYYTECNLLLTQIYQLEADLKRKQEYPLTALEDSYFERLNGLEDRVPSLRQMLNDLSKTYDDSSSMPTALRSKLSQHLRIAVSGQGLSSASRTAASEKLKEIEDGIARCRSLFSMYQESSIRAQRKQQVEARTETVSVIYMKI
ncbi:unnamed protein product [Dicrocoelium dendriticum]|nr:unnamed protein product [Dicrocoelium dendriticum]